ncbi:unnamed protein product [Lymnaea stagnalis]|uniref:Transmembrane protein n=1 Tax=Lymnaea stagnalis TaxID=6523 RepID=A0AAV2HUQ7_LYMST
MVQIQYSVAQRVAFAGLTLGFLMCFAGVIPPFWVTAKLSPNILTQYFGVSIPIIGSIELISMNGGLWWYCVDVVTRDSVCDVNSMDFSEVGAWVMRVCSVVNLILSLVCALVALCRSCCCCGGKTVCHGVMTFFAGAAGVAVVVLFSQSMEDLFFFQLSLAQYGWAFYVYIVGSALMTIMSFVLCFAPPTNPSTPMIFNGVGQVPTGIQPMTNVQINQPVSLQNNMVNP